MSKRRFCTCATAACTCQPDPQGEYSTAQERAWAAKIDQLQARVAELEDRLKSERVFLTMAEAERDEARAALKPEGDEP